MANTFIFSLVTPERTLISGDASQVVLRTGDGDITFMAGHSPFIGNVEPCILSATMSDGEVMRAAVHAGFVHVTNAQVRVLADIADLPEDIDVDLVKASIDEMEEALMHSHDAEVEATLRRAHVRLELANSRGAPIK